MVLNKRRSLLVSLLLQRSGIQSTESLACELGVSRRTVRYDLDLLRDWLSDQGIRLESHRGEGFSLNGAPEALARAGTALEPSSAYDYELDTGQRQQLLLAEVLSRSGPVTVSALCDAVYSGRQTVLHDLDRVAAWLGQYGVSLERKTGVGVQAKGPETALRRAVFELLMESGLSPTAASAQPAPLHRRILTLAFDQQTPRLQERLRVTLQGYGFRMTDEAETSLLAHLSIAALRSEDRALEMDTEVVAALSATPEYAIARQLAGEVTAVYGRTLPPNEVAYLTMHLMGAKLRAGFGEDGEAAAVAADFLARAESVLGVELQTDEELLGALMIHLRPIFHRLRFGLVLRNPLLKEIKSQYPELFAVARICAGAIAEAAGHAVPEAEIGFLAMHLGAALERRKLQQPSRRRALVVCGSGIGTARFLAFLLSARVAELEIIGAASASDASTEVERLRPDLIITTLPINLPGIPTVTINTLAREDDVERVRQAIRVRQTRDAGRTGDGLVPAPGGRDLPACLTESHICLDRPCADWESAIRAAGDLLVQAGDVEPGYVDAMVAMVHHLGPYIVVAPGIAMPHAVPGGVVHRVCLSLVRLAEPIAFGHKQHDPVDLVFALGGLPDESHLTMLTQLMRLFQEPERLAEIRDATDAKAVLQALHGL